MGHDMFNRKKKTVILCLLPDKNIQMMAGNTEVPIPCGS